MEIQDRLERLRVSEGWTWEEFARRLGLSRSMLMMTKRGDRQLSGKALDRLERLEQAAATRRSQAELAVKALLEGDGPDVHPVLGVGKANQATELPLEYRTPQGRRSFPAQVSLSSPSPDQCRRLRLLFAETLDTTVVVLSCLPATFRSQRFLQELTSDSRVRLTNASLSLVIPDWRNLAAGGGEASAP